ncbi:hypothetical protein SKAU_G00356520 [Synaphobranchus kaupii]|uniref:Uncharacterized protein n=1 Tax=Synaphobranchus kaupii TaxID=118154 RepID=A0A9Q1IGN2_SYNKA|nr:hypothetical protein SKAU_G00356520 [Synaphobranchus kaupii]
MSLPRLRRLSPRLQSQNALSQNSFPGGSLWRPCEHPSPAWECDTTWSPRLLLISSWVGIDPPLPVAIAGIPQCRSPVVRAAPRVIEGRTQNGCRIARANPTGT